MQPKAKPDIPKIIFVGIPLLLMLWGMMFVLLAFLSRDIYISKYGAFSFFILSIPLYGYLAIKNASKINAVVDDNEKKIRSGDVQQVGPRKYVTKYDLWIAGIFIVLLPLGIFIGQVIYGVKSEIISSYFKIAIPVVIVIEVFL